mmetsp:Transcript_83579/g.166879  ORF Transcript_83579/g.166879 Transcript_83579/m.166879 type:complete len:88 (-) Transcript_83579:314-577(-)
MHTYASMHMRYNGHPRTSIHARAFTHTYQASAHTGHPCTCMSMLHLQFTCGSPGAILLWIRMTMCPYERAESTLTIGIMEMAWNIVA